LVAARDPRLDRLQLLDARLDPLFSGLQKTLANVDFARAGFKFLPP